VNAEAFKKYRIKSNPSEALIAATIGFFVGFAAVALFNVTAKNFKEAMGLDPVQVGLLVAMPMLSGSLLRIPFSAWVDTDGGRKPMLTLLGMSIVGLLGLIGLIVAYYPDHLSAGSPSSSPRRSPPGGFSAPTWPGPGFWSPAPRSSTSSALAPPTSS